MYTKCAFNYGLEYHVNMYTTKYQQETVEIQLLSKFSIKDVSLVSVLVGADNHINTVRADPPTDRPFNG